jgi:hypothetical protein
MIQERKLKNMRAKNIGIRMGISQENHCEMLFPEDSKSPPIPFSIFLIVLELPNFIFYYSLLVNIEAALLL